MSCENGLSMLVHQAARSLSIWTKQDISSGAMFSSAKLALKQ
jgi:shikimate 5-dehydrogenase